MPSANDPQKDSDLTPNRKLKIEAAAIGAIAVGAMAIGALSIGAGRVRRQVIDELPVKKLVVNDQPPAP